MITQRELVLARDTLLERTVSFFAEQPDVTGIFLAGSLPAGCADAYSDIDLRIIATTVGQRRLVAVGWIGQRTGETCSSTSSSTERSIASRIFDRS
jgi:hypothetical protein